MNLQTFAASDPRSLVPPEGWTRATLDDACEFLDSQRIPVNQTERLRRTAGKPQSDLYPYYGATGQVGWIDDYLFDEPLVLLAEDGADFGSPSHPIAYAVTGRYWVNNHAHVLRPKAGVDFDFLLHALMIRPDVGDLVSGSTRAKLGQAVAKRIPILLPPLAEQRRIAGLLRAQLDATARLRTAGERQLAATNQLAKKKLDALFEESRLASWPTASLPEIADIVAGVTLGRQLAADKVRMIAYLRVANVKDGRLDLEHLAETPATESEIARLKLCAGDLVLTEGGDPDKLGRGTIWSNEVTECIHQNHIFRVRLNLDVANPAFVSAQLGSGYGKAYFARHAKQTTGIATINQRVLKAFPLRLPPLEIQDSIAQQHAELVTAQRRLDQQLRDQQDLVRRLPAVLIRSAFSDNSPTSSTEEARCPVN